MTPDEQRLFDGRAERLDQYRNRIATLEAAFATVQADAERYRWIRQNSIVPPKGRKPIKFPTVPLVEAKGDYYTRVDLAVDAARGAV
jgi:hypothetical protein